VQGPLRFALFSRGDPVGGRLWLGPGLARPLVLVTPPLGSATDAPPVAALSAALAAAGLAAAALDLPLQGERASRKLSARLQASAGGTRSAADQRLWDAFLRQAALDLAAATRELAARREVDARQLGCVAFEPGAEAALAWAAREPRVRAVRRVAGDVATAELVAFVRERLGV
jgi:dienelactone hydrolase